MSKQSNKTLIGIFVLGAIALLVAGVLIFGSGKFLAESEEYVLYFEGSVKGLNIGAPVMFRGVKIGSVTDILLRYNPEDLTVHIPVIIEVERGRFKSVTGKETVRTHIKVLIDRGLRAQLQLQSVVTGQLMVDLDFYPDEPSKLVGTENTRISEIPTIPSGLQKFTKAIEQLPLDELFNKVVKTVESIEGLVNSPEVSGSFASLKKALDSADKLLVHVDNKIDPLVVSIEDTSIAARDAFVQAEKTLAFNEGVPGGVASDLRESLVSARDSLKQADQTLKQARETLVSIEEAAGENSTLIYEVNTTLRELSAAARSVRYLADYLDRQPEALIRGKAASQGE